MSFRNRIADFIAGTPQSSAAIEPTPNDAATPVIKNEVDQTPITEIVRGSDAWHRLFGPGSSAGLPVPTVSSALTSTAVYACTNLISTAIMALPLNLFKVDISNGERDRQFNDDLIWVLNEEMSARWAASAGWEFLSCSMLFEGDAFALIERDRAGRPIGLTPAHPGRVNVCCTTDGSRLVYDVAPEWFGGQQVGSRRIVDQDDMVHVPGWGFDGRRGLSPLRSALRNAGAVAIASQEYAGRFYANNARPDYALQTDSGLGKEKVQELREQIDEHHNGVANSHRPMILHSGLKVAQNWQISPIDMQLLESRQFQVEEIARAYGVPPFMIGHNEKTTSWGSGVEGMGKAFVRYTLRQYLHKFEVELNRKLFRTASRIVEFDTSDLERADFQTLMTALRAGVGRAGEPQIMSQNEARAILRLNKADGGDKVGFNPGQAMPEPKQPEGQQS